MIERIDGPLGRFMGRPRNLVICAALAVAICLAVWWI